MKTLKTLILVFLVASLMGCSFLGIKTVDNTPVVSASATSTPTATVVQPTVELATLAVVLPAATVAPTETEVVVSVPPGISDVLELSRADGALEYPVVEAPDASKWLVFPNELARYEVPFEDGDYFETGHGDIDLPQYYFRVMTAGTVEISQLGVSCEATPEKGCAVILINHFGETAMFRDTVVDNGFTVAGLVFDMSTPGKVVIAAQALLDHYMYRMTVVPNDGANCSVITGCPSVEWHVVIVGNGEAQVHWTGTFQR